MRAQVVLGLIWAIGVVAQADEAKDFNPYRFGGACGSQGSWTQQALQRTAQLRAVISDLRDDPNCTALKTQMQNSLAGVAASLETLNTESDAAQSASQLPAEIGALRTFLAGNQEFRGPVIHQMFSKMVQKATVEEPEIFGPPTERVWKDRQNDDRASRIMSLGRRSRLASSTGLRLFNETIDVFPRATECLGKNQNVAGQMLASSVQILAAFVSAGQGTEGNQLAQTISKLASYSREGVYAKALRQLKENEFMASLSCLLELTSENYCATRDARLLFDEMIRNNEIVQGDHGEPRLKGIDSASVEQGNALQGYYVLTQNMPVINEWLQMIQLGAEPRLKTDSAQKNDPIDQMSKFQQAINDIRASVNTNLETIRSYAPEEKTLAVVNMANELYNKVLGSNGAVRIGRGGGGDGSPNFFTLTIGETDMLFYLLGIPTPPAVTATTGGQQQDPTSWLLANYKTLPQFNDPDGVAKTLSLNLNRLVERANISAITYYNKWLIFDKVLITNRALIGVNYNVKESLLRVRAYLLQFEDKVKRLSQDPSLIPHAVDTRLRVETVLRKFAELEQFGQQVSEGKVNRDIVQGKMKELSEKLVETTFEQFYVMLGKSGWLQSRMSDFVVLDYQMMQRAGIGLNSQINEIYAASGRVLVDQVIRSAEGNPAGLMTDLSMALRLGKGNLEAMETGLAESYLDQIAVLEHIARGYKGANGTTMWTMKHPESLNANPLRDEIPGQNAVQNNVVVRGAIGFWRSYLGSFGDVGRLYSQGNEYWSTPLRHLSPDDEFGSAKILKAQYCVQTLAFARLSPFWELCKATELQSPFAAAKIDVDASKAFAAKYNMKYFEKAWEDLKDKGPEVNYSKRICAFRDFNRRNLVLYLTQSTKHGSFQAMPDLGPAPVIQEMAHGAPEAPAVVPEKKVEPEVKPPEPKPKTEKAPVSKRKKQ